MSYELDWEEPFPPIYGSTIQLPPGLILWRGYELNNEPILSRPSFYSSKQTASEYAKISNRSLGAFYSTKHLNLLDVRFLRDILKGLFEQYDEEEYTPDEATCIKAVIISFGVCTLKHQVSLMKDRFAGFLHLLPGIQKMEESLKSNLLIEQPGIRASEPTNDGITMTFLKKLFKYKYDGIISPRLVSIFHQEKKGLLPSELLLFDPKTSGVERLRSYPKSIQKLKPTYFAIQTHPIVTIDQGPLITQYYMNGGKRTDVKKGTGIMNSLPSIEEFNKLLTNNNSDALKSVKLAKELGKKWRKMDGIYTAEPPHPTIPVSIFMDSSYNAPLMLP